MVTAVAVLVCEGTCRLIERVGCRDRAFGFTVRDRRWGWSHRPGARGWLQGCNGDRVEWLRVNARGLRGDDVPYERRCGFRVLVLGDSFTEGLQVSEEQTFVKRLERRLADSAPAGMPVEVLNAGVSAWGTDNELEFYRDEAAKYRPDVVLLAFDTANDLYENTRELVATNPFYPDKPYFVRERGRLVRMHSPLPEASVARLIVGRIAGPLALHSALVRRLAAVPAVRDVLLVPPPSPLLGDEPAEPMDVYLAHYPPVWRNAWRVTRALLLAFRRDVERDGARFAVVVIDGREVVSPKRWQFAVGIRPGLRGAALDADKPHRLVTAFLARHGIPTIALLDAFRARFAADATPGHFVVDIHWTPVGHALAADVIAAGLDEQGLVPRRTDAATDVRGTP